MGTGALTGFSVRRRIRAEADGRSGSTGEEGQSVQLVSRRRASAGASAGRRPEIPGSALAMRERRLPACVSSVTAAGARRVERATWRERNGISVVLKGAEVVRPAGGWDDRSLFSDPPCPPQMTATTGRWNAEACPDQYGSRGCGTGGWNVGTSGHRYADCRTLSDKPLRPIRMTTGQAGESASLRCRSENCRVGLGCGRPCSVPRAGAADTATPSLANDLRDSSFSPMSAPSRKRSEEAADSGTSPRLLPADDHHPVGHRSRRAHVWLTSAPQEAHDDAGPEAREASSASPAARTGRPQTLLLKSGARPRRG